MTPEELERIELLRELIASGGGTNLAGQTATDPTYSSGQAYAQQISGGVIPNSQVIAPGVSYSPEQAGGYTQADLDMIAAGPAPVMPIAPTTGEVATIDNQMEFAPVGTTEPTRFSIGDTLFPNVDYLQGLDFSGLPALGNIDVDAIIKEYQDRQDAGEPEPFESFFTEPSQAPVMPQIPAYQEPVNFTAVPQAPVLAPVMPSMPGEPEPIVQPIAAPIAPVQTLPQNIFANIPQPVIPQPVIQKPIPQEPIEVSFIPDFSNIPMNFTGLPNMPVIPQSIAPTPVIPQMPIMPRIPQIAYTPPASSFIQPRVEEIVSPIRSGSPRNFQQPGLFNLV